MVCTMARVGMGMPAYLIGHVLQPIHADLRDFFTHATAQRRNVKSNRLYLREALFMPSYWVLAHTLISFALRRCAVA